MINVNDTAPLRYHQKTPQQTDENECWFDAIDYVEMNEKWFDACETLPAETVAEAVVPFTEDCRRCVKQLITLFGSYKQSELLSYGLARIFPGIPVNILFAADSLYTAMTEKRNIDIAVLHALGLTSGQLPDNINLISWVAGYIRNTILNYAGDTFNKLFLNEEENPAAGYVFTMLAIAAVAARYWMRDEQAPQRRVLRTPAFIANLLVRASHYWTVLGNMAQQETAGKETAAAEPAFAIDTSVEITQLLPESTGTSQRRPFITAFLSNSTTLPEFSTKATVENRATNAPYSDSSVAEQAHTLAMIKAKQETGLADLMYCDTYKTKTIQRQRERIITHAHFNTQCDATAHSVRHSQTQLTMVEKSNIPVAQASSASRKTVIPLLTTAAVATTATTYWHSPISKKVFAASAIASAATLVLGGKLLFGRFYSGEEKNTPPSAPVAERYKRALTEPKIETPAKITVDKLLLKGDNKKKIFEKFKLESDITGKLTRSTPQKLINSHILSFGSKIYNSEGFFTLTLPRIDDAIKVRVAGIVNPLTKGMNEIKFAVRVNTQTTKTLFFFINGARNKKLFTMSKLGHKLIINHDGNEKIINNCFHSITNATSFEVAVNKGKHSFITVWMDTHKIFNDLMEKDTRKYFIGIAGGPPNKYFKSIDIKDVSRTHTANHPLHTDWHNFISVAKQAGIKFDRAIDPFTSDGVKFYGSAENLLIRKKRRALVNNIFNKLRNNRSIEGEATFTTVLNATSMAYLIRVLGDPNCTREEKEIAITEYIKTAAADAFSFSSGLVDHLDPYTLVSPNYATGMKGLLKTGGAAVGVIFNAMNFVNGVKENDIAKIVSSTIGIAGAIAGVVLSGLTGFGVALFFLGLKLIIDAIGDAKLRGEARDKYFHQTILQKERNQLFHYTWMAKTNQDGNSEERDNPFKLDNENTPGVKQVNGEDDKPLFYTMLAGDVKVSPEMVGIVNGSTTFNTKPGSEHEGFIGFNTRVKEADEEITHLIYASHTLVPDTSYIGHENYGRDSILADDTLLKGDDTIVSGSIDAKINAGAGNDIIFITGREESIDGGTGANIAIIDGSGGKVILNIYGDGDASLDSGTRIRNIAGFVITGKGHKVIINSGGLNNIVPILVCQGDGIIILRNPAGNGEEAIVKEYGSKERVKEGALFKYHTVLNRVSIGEKTIAMQKGFGVKQIYDA